MPARSKYRSHVPARKKAPGLLKRRGITLRYLAVFWAGVLLGSIYAAANGAESLPCRILLGQLKAVPEGTVFQLLQSRLLFAAILLLYLLIAGRCLWGRYLIPAVPFLFGLSQGAAVTFYLILLGWNAFPFLGVCVLLPKAVLLILLILLCCISHNRCVGVKNTAAEQGSGGELPQLLLTAAVLAECVLEQLLLKRYIPWIL